MLRESEEDARAAYVLPERSRAAVNETTEQALLDRRLVWLAEEGSLFLGLFTIKLDADNLFDRD